MRDIMRNRGRLLAALIILGILSSVVLPSVNAEVFDIGTKISESDLDDSGQKLVYYDSGCMLHSHPDYLNYTSLIFDGNESTGIDKNFGPGHSKMLIRLVFPYFINISNITIKPNFGVGNSNYSLYIYVGPEWFSYANKINVQKTIQINGKITGLSIELDNGGSNHFYFNDVIINYTSSPLNLTDVIAAIDILSNTVNSLQSQINNLNQKIDNMNDTINSLNQTQLQILENLTTLQSNYNQINNSLMSLFNEIQNLNITTNENITLLKDDLTLIESNINVIYQSLDDLSSNITELSEIQNLIDQTTQEILYLDENITEIKSTMPSEYDDTILTNRVFQLESENTALNVEITNLTIEIDNLTTEIEKLKDTQDGPDDPVAYGGFVFSILAILIAIVAIILASRKLGEQTPPEDKEESEESIPSEEDENKIDEEET